MKAVAPKLLLELFIQTNPGEKSRRAEFARLARDFGIELRPILMPGVGEGDPVPANYFEDIERAAAYWIREPHLLRVESTKAEIIARLRAGKTWVIVSFDRNYMAEQNAFLAEFGVAGTWVGAFRKPDDRPEHQRLVFLRRDEHPSSFRDPLLFANVNELALSSVQGLHQTGAAQSVLAIPDGEVELVDTKRDLFADWSAPELSCMAVWRPPRGHGGLLVLGTILLADPDETIFGSPRPGISGADNRAFAANLLRVVADLPAPPPFDWTAAFGLLSQIEQNLFAVTKQLLTEEFFDEWWAKGVPENIRSKCANRKSSESGYPEHAYLELIDYKKILSAGSIRASAAFNARSVQSLIERVHPIRKKTAHPTKTAAINQGRPTREERKVLEDAAKALVLLYSEICGVASVADDD